jgi:hypothetical protein
MKGLLGEAIRAYRSHTVAMQAGCLFRRHRQTLPGKREMMIR